jgi:hypothetical protein
LSSPQEAQVIADHKFETTVAFWTLSATSSSSPLAGTSPTLNSSTTSPEQLRAGEQLFLDQSRPSDLNPAAEIRSLYRIGTIQ